MILDIPDNDSRTRDCRVAAFYRGHAATALKRLWGRLLPEPPPQGLLVTSSYAMRTFLCFAYFEW
jgi:hypothetical protein